MNIKLSNGKEIPVEMHKVRIVQKTSLVPIRRRLEAISEAGYNTFLLRTKDVFLDMLTDSGTNAMSDNQLAAMMVSDDAYAGSESFYKLAEAVKEILGFNYTMPVHQGRAAEHLLAKVFIKPGDVVLMNYHFTTTKAHFELAGATVLEIYTDEALNTQSTEPFRGNLDLRKFAEAIKKYGASKIPFVRMEATTNLIGGQPFSLRNLREVKKMASAHNIPLVYDGSLISENAYFIKQREEGYANKSITEIIAEMMSLVDIFYLSARKSTSVRGGMIATNNKEYYDRLLAWLPVYEGFATYGGMSTKEIEAMAVGLREMTDVNVAGISPEFIQYFVNRLLENEIPVVTPPGGLACHVDAKRFLPHLPQSQYPAGALAAAIYIASGVRSMERGTISMDRDAEGREVYADLELARLAIPRRVYTLSQIEYTVDRLTWLYKHRDLVKGLRFVEEPKVLRFFFGRLQPLDNWGTELAKAFEADFGASC
ncbi:MAG: tryptophanase [candidate division KSB1 bacterium]|nr:tryptophanase [candidate division KSB1 bacterium]MDZ7302831.1 tryptophanase [candidate division KSB1 bacterium]MDZ7311848.1 tryptophanase [candidate division KSB1 bacterium]